MRFFHLSDLHIGKQLHHYNLKEDQKIILKEVVQYAKELHPDAIIIAGDIYDKSVPSAEAVTIFDDFLMDLSAVKPQIPILMISGNHDSAERLRYAAGFLKRHKIYVASNVPKSPDEYIEKVVMEDEYGPVNFYLLPFLKPSYVRNVAEEAPETYTDAVKLLLDRENINAVQRNVLVTHQFYAGDSQPETCDSEMISVGGLDNVDVSVLERFDYAALGHLHSKQCVKHNYMRYCGTLLKYSVSESEHKKCLTMVTLKEKDKDAEVTELPLHPIRDVRKITGCLKAILAEEADGRCDDYVSITLTDEIDPYRPKDQLEKRYSHILEIRMDNQRTRNKLSEFDEELVMKAPFEAFEDFYREMQGRDLNDEELDYIRNVFEQAGEE